MHLIIFQILKLIFKKIHLTFRTITFFQDVITLPELWVGVVVVKLVAWSIYIFFKHSGFNINLIIFQTLKVKIDQIFKKILKIFHIIINFRIILQDVITLQE